MTQKSDKPSRRRGPGRPTLTNEQLLDIALDLFLEHGFERTSIDAITTAAGMAKRTVYARYGDKLSLFKAALDRAINDWLVPIPTLRAAEVDDLEETLVGIARLLLANILSPAGLRLLRLSNTVSVSMPEIAAGNTRMGTEPTLAYLADLFRRRLFDENVPEAEINEAALAFLHLVVGGPATTAGWGGVLDNEALERHAQYCIHLFLYGTLPRSQGAGRYENAAKLIAEANCALDTAHERLRHATAALGHKA